MATADTTTADSISGLGETLQNLININVTGFAGIESSLRSEFKGQNKLLGGYLGKNLQLIAEAITGTSEAMLSQMQADARSAAEAAREALAGKGGDAAAGGVEAKDMSIQWNPVTILAATAGFLIGFFQGFFGPMGTLMKSWGGAIKSFFGKPLKWGWTKFSTMLADSKIGAWYKSVKGWFKTKIGWKLIDLKAAWTESTLAKFVTKIKAWFGAKTGMILPKIKTLWANSAIGRGITAIKGLFGGGVKIPGIGAIDDVLMKVKNLFGTGGPFQVFKTIGQAFGKLFFFVQIFMTLFDFYTGFVETEGNLLDKILGGLKAAFVGFFGGFMDLGIMLEDGLKWIVAKIAGFFGFDEEEVAASMESFSIFKPLKQMVTDVADWFVGLFDFSSFSAGLISAAKLLFLPITALLDLTGFVWDWFMELFGWKDENAPKDERTLTTKLGDLLVGVWDWFKGLFTFSSPEEDADSTKGVGGFLKDLVDGVWGYFKKLFKFGSIGDVMKSYFNLLTFFPNIIKDAIAGVTSWLLGLFGFDEAAKTVANAQNFSLGDMVFNALESIWKWFTELLNIDVGAIFKSRIPEDSLLGKAASGLSSLFGGDSEAHTGGLVKKGGLVNLEAGEVVQTGAQLSELQKESNELSGSGSATTIIQDNSQNVSSSSQPIVIPTSDIAPGNSGNVLQQ